MTIADVALRSIAKLERSIAKWDVGVNYADWREFGYFFRYLQGGGGTFG